MKRLCTLLLAAILCFSISGTTLAAEITDVPEDAAYSDAVRWTVEQGIISPGADGTFRPSATCTRSEVVAMLWRIAGQPAPTLEVSPFRDVSPDTPNYYATLWAAEEGITVGCGADVFAPDDLCTDAQVLTFLWRADGMPSVPEPAHWPAPMTVLTTPTR